MFSKEKSWILWNIALLKFFAKPQEAEAPYFPPRAPNVNENIAVISIAAPIRHTYFMLPPSSPLSIIAAINNGIIISIITSKIINIGVKIVSFLYSLMYSDNFFIIFLISFC